MSTSAGVVFGLLLVFGYLGTPVLLIWGWARWTRLAKQRTVFSTLSLISFILATTSALLALSTVAYALIIRRFAFYDPLLLRVFRLGFVLSLGATVLGTCGVWRASSLRWHAPLSALGTLAFWIMAASGE